MINLQVKTGFKYQYIDIFLYQSFFGGFMLVRSVDKQRRGVSVVKTALLGVGISGRSICVQVSSWVNQYGNREDYMVFVSAPDGANVEPFYETGQTLVEAVKKTLNSIKGRVSGAKTEVSEVAPF
jgi:hypothetical protein